MSLPAHPGVDHDCRRVGSVLSLIGDKWTVMIVMILFEPRGGSTTSNARWAGSLSRC